MPECRNRCGGGSSRSPSLHETLGDLPPAAYEESNINTDTTPMVAITRNGRRRRSPMWCPRGLHTRLRVRRQARVQAAPVTTAEAFQELLRWINAHDTSLSARTTRVLSGGAYGWVEHVSVEICSPSEAHHFYRQQGRLLSLLHAISSTDFHSENLLAAGGRPILVDLETVFSPAGEPAVRAASASLRVCPRSS